MEEKVKVANTQFKVMDSDVEHVPRCMAKGVCKSIACRQNILNMRKTTSKSRIYYNINIGKDFAHRKALTEAAKAAIQAKIRTDLRKE
jgi:hypothetical protein